MNQTEQDKKWEIDDAARTIERYTEISVDQKLMNAAKKVLQERRNRIDMAITKLKMKGQ